MSNPLIPPLVPNRNFSGVVVAGRVHNCTVIVGHDGYEGWTVGEGGVTRIVVSNEVASVTLLGETVYKPWVAVLVGDEVLARVKASRCMLTYETSLGDGTVA